MKVTYAASANATTNGVALGAADEDIRVYKVIVGLPVASGNIILYDKTIAYSGDTSNIAFKTTLPSTITYQYSYPVMREWDFGEKGLPLNGGNLMIDQAMQVTVVWEPLDEATNA